MIGRIKEIARGTRSTRTGSALNNNTSNRPPPTERQRTTPPIVTSRRLTARNFDLGDEVEITNRVGIYKGDKATREDRVGVVYEVHESRIRFITKSGIDTWRAPHNLKIISKRS